MRQWREEAGQLGVALNDAQLALFARYMQILQEWNQRLNLTAITTPEEIISKHFLDSLSCLTVLHQFGRESSTVRSLIDIGSGGGFPGVPLKIAQPEWQLTLLEAKRKKAAFLEALVAELGLDEVQVVSSRAEVVAFIPQHREAYDLVTARAVAELATLAEYTLPFARCGGWVLAQKGEDPAEESRRAVIAIRSLGGKHLATVPVVVPQLQATRHIVVIEKIAPTPENYPRRPGIPEKRPLG